MEHLRTASRRLRPVLLWLVGISAAAAAGFFAVGAGDPQSWFLVTAALTILTQFLLLGYPEQTPPLSRREYRGLGSSTVRALIALLASSSAVVLGWLVINGQPLPIDDVATSALVTVLFCAGATIAVLHVNRLPVLSFTGLFLGATFLFTCSSLILYQTEGLGAFSGWQLIDIPSVLVGMPVVMLAFVSFLLGVLLAPRSSTTGWSRAMEPYAGEGRANAETRALRKIALIAYVASIGVIVVFSLSGSALSFVFEGGYAAFTGARKAGMQPALVRATLSSFLPESLLVMAATSVTARAYLRVMLLAIPGLGIFLLTGDRGRLLPLLLLLVICGRLLGLRLTWKQALPVIGLVLLLIPAIANFRKTAITDWSVDALRDSVTNQVEGRPAYNQGPATAVFASTGASYQTLMATVRVVPSLEGYRYGRDYLRLLLAAIPFAEDDVFLGVDLGQEPSDWVKSILNDDRNAGPGYLQVAEAYLQFGAIGVFALYGLLGWGLSRLWQYLTVRHPDPRVLALSLIVMSRVLLWVRNQSTGVLRALVWGVLLVYVAPVLWQAAARSWIRMRNVPDKLEPAIVGRSKQ